MVIGYDLGDRYYDTSDAHDEVHAWFEANVAGPARKVILNRPLRVIFARRLPTAADSCNPTIRQRGIVVSVKMAMCNNTQRKPGPVFTTATRAAYAEGADWIYRVNDDSEFLTPWTTKLVEAVTSMGIPYGVAGPLVCNQGGNVKILTHDFTHRTHMEIFGGWCVRSDRVGSGWAGQNSDWVGQSWAGPSLGW